jgi:hypothetical protein
MCTLSFREDRLLILPYCIALAMFVCATETVSYETSQLVKRLKRWHTTVGCKIDKPDPARRLGTPNLQKNPCNFMESSEPSQPILDFFSKSTRLLKLQRSLNKPRDLGNGGPTSAQEPTSSSSKYSSKLVCKTQLLCMETFFPSKLVCTSCNADLYR